MSNAIRLAAALAMAVPHTLAAQSISPSDKAQGAEANPKLIAQFGGTYLGPQADYVRRVGQRIAVQSGLSNDGRDFTVTLLNSPVDNAFAIPGGYVYVTRNLVALMNDEAELAFVLGHEVGHVAARHSRSRSQTSTIASVLAGVVGAVAGNSGLGALLGQGAGTVAQLVTLRFSRTQEYQADDLGIRYLAGAGYDPLASATILTSLAAQSRLDQRAAGREETSASWASTHPDPGARVNRAVSTARAAAATGAARNRADFLAAIDGMPYGDDPKQGVVEGQSFLHPVLRIAFTAPNGYAIANGAEAVAVSGRGGQAQFAGGAYTGDLDAYVARVFSELSSGRTVNVDATRRTTTNGLPTASATLRANTQRGPVDATVTAYAIDPRTVYHILTITAAGTGPGAFTSMLASVRRLAVAEAARIRGRRIAVVTVKAGDTIASLSGRMSYPSLQSERFAVLNALPPGAVLRPGDKVKLIVSD